MQKAYPIKISNRSGMFFSIAEIWAGRELLFSFTWRIINVKYKEAFLGLLWVVLQPLLLTGLFFLVFSKHYDQSTDIPYPIYLFAGLSIWGLFSSAITNSSESIIGNAPIIKKIYFPRLLIPLSSTLAAIVDFVITLVFLAVMFIFYRHPIGWQFVFFFPAVILTLLSAFGIGALLSALNLQYRDFRYLLPFIIQLLFFSSQIIYSLRSVDNEWLQWLLYINPMNGILELFYYSLGRGEINMMMVLTSCIVTCISLVTGISYFRKVEAYFADIA